MKDRKRLIRIAATIAAFLALMLVTLIPKFKEKNNRLVSAGQLRSISLALKQYASDYSNHFPDKPGAEGLNVLLNSRYLAAPAIYLAPADNISQKSQNHLLKEDNTSYAYVGAGLSPSSAAGDYPMLFEKPWLAKPPYYIVLFSGEVVSSGDMPPVSNCEEFIRHSARGQSDSVWNKLLENARAIDRACGK